MISRLIHGVRKLTNLAVLAVLLVGSVPHAASATVTNPVPKAKVSFTFDDGYASVITQAAPILANHGLTGTSYITTGCVGMVTVPNTCRANTDVPYMTWAQVQSLQNTYGWEIGSHTVSHRCLASSAVNDPDDCQAAALTPAQVASELSGSQADLAAHGITATDIAPPYGDYSNAVLAQIAKYYASMRGFKDQNDNVWPYNEYLLNNVPVRETIDTVTSVKAKIDRAITNNHWLVLSFHDIVVSPSQDPDNYQYGTAELDQIAAYVAAKQTAGLLTSVHVNQGSVTSTTNMLPNGSFNNGVADGWTTDNATAITKDTATNGSYPDAVNAMKLVSPAGGASAHLFSPKVSVNSNTSYLFKSFLNVQAISSGQVAFYVDEYDTNGNWISGQYLRQERTAFVENMNFTYRPSSVAVEKASLQIIVGGSGITSYLDNMQMFALASTPAPTNLVANGTFDNGIANGWLTDTPTAIKPDSQNHGSPANLANSVSFTAGAVNSHLFSPKVAVNSAQTYNLSSFLNLQVQANEVGFYMDEYDTNGNWISGKYITGVRVAGVHTVGFAYTPSSTNVKSASLQVVVVGNSGATGYYDDVTWYQV